MIWQSTKLSLYIYINSYFNSNSPPGLSLYKYANNTLYLAANKDYKIRDAPFNYVTAVTKFDIQYQSDEWDHRVFKEKLPADVSNLKALPLFHFNIENYDYSLFRENSGLLSLNVMFPILLLITSFLKACIVSKLPALNLFVLLQVVLHLLLDFLYRHCLLIIFFLPSISTCIKFRQSISPKLQCYEIAKIENEVCLLLRLFYFLFPSSIKEVLLWVHCFVVKHK